jgi:hypothetical protein
MMPEKLDKAKVTEQLEQLQLEEALANAETRRSRTAERRNRVQAIERSLTEGNARQRDIQSRCAHRKGGKGVAMLYQGNDSNYAVIKHTLSHGPTIVICQRCAKLWEPPDKKLIAKGATTEQRAEYRRLAQEYQWALNLPTDNEPSGTVLFAIHEESAA